MSPLHSESRARRSRQSPTLSMRTLVGVIAAHLCLLGMVLSHQAPKHFPEASEMIVSLISSEALAMSMPELEAASRSGPEARRREARRGDVRERPVPAQAVFEAVAATESGGESDSHPSEGGGEELTRAGGGSSDSTASESGSPAGGASEPSAPPGYDAGYLRNPAPVYPAPSRRLGEEGRVLLNVFVESSGLPMRVEIRQSSGSTRLDLAAREAVRRWRFVPARRGAEAIAAWVVVPVVFSLNG